MIVGCHNQKGEPTMAMPSLAHPRSADIQQKRALRYDPYPETRGGPEMVGVRPREYQNPPAEASAARWHFPADQQNKIERWGTNGNDPTPCPQ
jgi:hypothetical protein